MIEPDGGRTEHQADQEVRGQQQCLCGGMGAAFSQLLRTMGPQGEAGQHFRQAQIETLKGLRSLLDQRIDSLGRTNSNKGTRVTVE